LHFSGFDEFTPEQSAFIDAQRTHGVTITCSPGVDASHHLRARIVDCNDFDAEIETATRWVAQWVQAHPAARVGLVVPGLRHERERVRQALDRVLVPAVAVTGGPAPESVAYELAAARALGERPVVAAAIDWLEAFSGSSRRGVLNPLLLGSHDGAAATERFGRAELDVDLRRKGTVLRSFAAAAAAARRAGCTATADQFDRAAIRTKSWQNSRYPSAWSIEFSGALREVGWPGEHLDSAEHQSVQRWQSLLGELGASDEITGRLSAGAALAHLCDLAQHTAFEPQEIAAPLLVIDPETAVGMKFDAVWICGLEASRWPAPASPDPFLPRDWQARQRVPDATAELAEAAARRALLRLTQSAPVAICSVPSFDKDAPLLPSSLVATLPRCADLELWTGRSTTQVIYDARPRLESQPDGRLPAFATHEVARGGSRLLELQAACPFRAAVELRLGGRALENPGLGITPAERGKLIHLVLQTFWSEVRTHSVLLDMSQEERASRIHQIVTQLLAPLLASADDIRACLLDLEQHWLEARARELLERDAAREPFTVLQVESSHVVEVAGVQLRVKLDRVDRLQDGTCAFIDYKTGANAKPSMWMGERPELPQLPLYVRTATMNDVGDVAFGCVRAGATAYTGFVHAPGLFEGLRPFDRGHRLLREYSDWKSMLAQWQRRVEALGREHAGGDARLAPNPKKACELCHLPGVCRSAQALFEADEEESGDDVG
jgi:probable DNA repair protein